MCIKVAFFVRPLFSDMKTHYLWCNGLLRKRTDLSKVLGLWGNLCEPAHPPKFIKGQQISMMLFEIDKYFTSKIRRRKELLCKPGAVSVTGNTVRGV